MTFWAEMQRKGREDIDSTAMLDAGRSEGGGVRSARLARILEGVDYAQVLSAAQLRVVVLSLV